MGVQGEGSRSHTRGNHDRHNPKTDSQLAAPRRLGRRVEPPVCLEIRSGRLFGRRSARNASVCLFVVQRDPAFSSSIAGGRYFATTEI
jgi:hypothetical protein